jgi:AI-2 transport protein TqsA
LEPAIAWGLLAFALNYIPFIGSFVATLLAALFAIAQLETWQAVILVFIGLSAIRSSSATISSRSPRGPRSPSRP